MSCLLISSDLQEKLSGKDERETSNRPYRLLDINKKYLNVKFLDGKKLLKLKEFAH